MGMVGQLDAGCYNLRLAGRRARKIYNDSRWKGWRAWFRANEPYCRLCAARGVDETAHDLDHIVPLDEGGAEFEMENLQPLCRQCHYEKTAAENRRRKFRQFRPLVDKEGRPLGREG